MRTGSVDMALVSLLQRTPETQLESTDTLLLEEMAFLEEELARAHAAGAEDKAKRVDKLLQNLRDRMRESIKNVETAMQSLSQEVEWVAYRDEKTGQLYYFNPLTGQTQWERPSDNPQLPPGWTEHVSSGKKFYYNRETKQSSFSLPAQ
eukprot:c10359_g1_i1.p1 GENE.c10359_g1_i1~~c10359_g1_i1.p1  ORF type:complete len:168 (+),score=33.81 c10359_g1_i1:59-505(+)